MGALLAIDIGNSNTVVGVYRGDEVVADWRLQTIGARTADEYSVLIGSLMAMRSIEIDSLDHAIVASVVPPAVAAVERFLRAELKLDPLIVGPGMKTGMPILIENPREVGADRIVNAVAAYDKLRCGCIVVDFGTATTWDVVSPQGEYVGGIIAPGVHMSAEALYQHTAKLPRVEICRPPRVVGKNTVSSMQSGLFYGYAGMVDAIVGQIRTEIDFKVRCIATGGLASMFAGVSQVIEHSDDMLTLHGLKVLFERNTQRGV